jgi:hypothetical protein
MIETLITFFSKNFLVILWVSTLSVFGAITSYIRKVKAGKIERFSISELVGDIAISFFLGVVTFLLCKSAGFDEYLTAGLVGLASHMGTRGIVMLEDFVPKVICKWLGLDCKDNKKVDENVS